MSTWSPGTGRLIAASCVLALAAAAVVWALADGLQHDVPDPDFLVRPIDGLVTRRWWVFVAGLLVAGACALALRRRVRGGRRVDPNIVLPIVLLGGGLGALYAVVTDPVTGANIGGGLALMGAPLAAGVLGWWFVRSLRLHRT